jgi:hypothetical protein
MILGLKIASREEYGQPFVALLIGVTFCGELCRNQ